MKIFDEYANILRGMYKGRINRVTSNRDASSQDRKTPQEIVIPPCKNLEAWHPNKVRKCRLNQDK
jgi:hypothetical protein